MSEPSGPEVHVSLSALASDKCPVCGVDTTRPSRMLTLDVTITLDDDGWVEHLRTHDPEELAGSLYTEWVRADVYQAAYERDSPVRTQVVNLLEKAVARRKSAS